MPDIFLPLILAVLAWLAPQPTHSAGLLVTYGGQSLIEANADWHGVDLSRYPNRCGFSAISPAMLGRIAWIRTPGHAWVGPCVSIDAVSRADAYGSIFQRHEIAEVSRATAAALGFEYGAQGEIFFGRCPPPATSRPLPYAPPLVLDTIGEHTPSLFPYPKQQLPIDCAAPPAGQVRAE